MIYIYIYITYNPYTPIPPLLSTTSNISPLSSDILFIYLLLFEQSFIFILFVFIL